MKGQNIGGKKSIKFHINPVQSSFNTPGGKWRTKLDNTSAEENEMGWQLLRIKRLHSPF
jgi:hypothetical protein